MQSVNNLLLLIVCIVAYRPTIPNDGGVFFLKNKQKKNKTKNIKMFSKKKGKQKC